MFIDFSFVMDDVRLKRFGEIIVWLVEVILEEFDDWRGEVKRGGLFKDVLCVEVVGNYELGKVVNDFGGRSDFNDVFILYILINFGLL